MPPTLLSVAQYLDLVNTTLRESIPATAFCIEGEISDFRIAQEKWVSFDLKDEYQGAVLKCFMTVWQMTSPLENGMRVRVMGSPKVYERFGTFKMNVTSVELVGEGALRRAYELLKKKLEAEGLFDAARKRPLPRFPERIGLITSRDAAAYGDFLRILNNRWGGVEVMHRNVHVQGKEAVPEILSAFAMFAALTEEERPDLIVLIRGGGGLEDLHAFNDEQVARAVFQARVPVVCGVGHERDESLCDFVADVRASTPSNAAERAVPNRSEVAYELDAITRRAEERLRDALATRSLMVERAARTMTFALERQRESFRSLERRLVERVNAWLPPWLEKIASHERVLKNVDPKRVLARGYSIVTLGGRVVHQAEALEPGGVIGVQLAHGSLDAEVLRINGKGKQRLI